MPYSHPQRINRERIFKESNHLWWGAVAFAVLAGFINAIALGFYHAPVSHMTGAASSFSTDLAAQHWDNAVATGSIIVGFLGGAVLSGFIVGAHDFLPGRRYGLNLFVECGLLIVATVLLMAQHRLGLPLVAMACGTQNAMTSSYCGLMIRTSHITGTVTDIGVMLGHWLRHRKLETWKLRFMLAMVGAFAGGVLVGAVANRIWGPACLFAAALACGVGGVVVWLSSQRKWLWVEREEAAGVPRTASFPRS